MSEGSFRVHLADPGGRISIRDVPADEFEAGERGISLGVTTIVPWHRVLRYTRDITLTTLGDIEMPTRSEIRAWVDDGSATGETIRVRSDRFESGPLTADFLVERAVNVETGTRHLTKVHVPWGRILEYERVQLPAEEMLPARPD